MKKKYDAIIIGSGISGLVCGCYLAKFGLKVLILEANDHPGGCCTSFKRNGKVYDSAAHTLGGMSKDGPIGKILEDLNIEDLNVQRKNPSFYLKVGSLILKIHNEKEKTLNQLVRKFPKEGKNIYGFFNFIDNVNPLELINLSRISFGELLDRYFNDLKLKAILGMPLLGNMGLDPWSASAFSALKFYKQYVFDGGYYLNNGMQELPDAFVRRYKKLGGEIFFSSKVEEIKVSNGSVEGVRVCGKVIFSKYVISNVDAIQTFNRLIGKKYLNSSTNKKLKELNPSSSMFLLYLELKKKLSSKVKTGVTYWFVNDYNIAKIYKDLEKNKPGFHWYAFKIHKGRRHCQLFSIAPFKDKIYWRNNKENWKKNFLEKVEKELPGLSNAISFVGLGTPLSILNWTSNSFGATCGWASTTNQFAITGFTQNTFLKNLYLTGHWTTLSLGLPGVANLGKSTAELIINKEKKYVK